MFELDLKSRKPISEQIVDNIKTIKSKAVHRNVSTAPDADGTYLTSPDHKNNTCNSLQALLESPHGYLKNAPPAGRRIVLLNRSDLLPPARLDALARDFLPRTARLLGSWDLLILGSLHALRVEAILMPERGR